jgi:hypothetical protein
MQKGVKNPVAPAQRLSRCVDEVVAVGAIDTIRRAFSETAGRDILLPQFTALETAEIYR